MTRQEVATIISKLGDGIKAIAKDKISDGCYTKNDIDVAKKMAIKALEQEPCEDAISRQAVIDMLLSMESGGVNELDANTIQHCIGNISILPSVKPVACIANVTFNKAQLQEIVEEKVNEMVEQCEDAISREYVLDKAYAVGQGLEPTGYIIDLEDVQNAPSVKPMRKRGRWEIYKGSGIIKCLKCGRLVCTESPDCYYFCPSCGADMREDGE